MKMRLSLVHHSCPTKFSMKGDYNIESYHTNPLNILRETFIMGNVIAESLSCIESATRTGTENKKLNFAVCAIH